ncbi:hypothetical protein F090043F1_42770 [Parabacteroides goldsteinii]
MIYLTLRPSTALTIDINNSSHPFILNIPICKNTGIQQKQACERSLSTIQGYESVEVPMLG